MNWRLLFKTQNERKASCSICGDEVTGGLVGGVVRLNPVKKDSRIFYYYHTKCFEEAISACLTYKVSGKGLLE